MVRAGHRGQLPNIGAVGRCAPERWLQASQEGESRADGETAFCDWDASDLRTPPVRRAEGCLAVKKVKRMLMTRSG